MLFNRNWVLHIFDAFITNGYALLLFAAFHKQKQMNNISVWSPELSFILSSGNKFVHIKRVQQIETPTYAFLH